MLLDQQQYRIIDQTNTGLHMSALHSFAMDDTLCQSVGSGESPSVMRSWVHEKTVVLGIQDTRLPFLREGLAYLHDEGYNVIVRNSGGLAVVLDEGVLNVTLIYSERDRGIDINRGYDAMLAFLADTFSANNVNMQAGEVVGSYCPGSYDISIQGKKFAGTSQRRLRGGVAVQVYLCLQGSGAKRAELVREFYRRALNGQETKFVYPNIKPETMASLSELTGNSMPTQDVMLNMFRVLKSYSHADIYIDSLQGNEWAMFEKNLMRITERNEKALML
ncbi:lipoate--protein ligase family protein [Bacillus sp. HMF5848]|uniref:lipoate--protein ligase family protein n=1 Tax=Bacillus sp. HMF5848 TaxID=2495421 RepID=UPI000F7B0C2D|nr:lipoate--protein ligase family protein [Bacillus sp. HMF5848]RSK28998.1 lipoate--protein ligase family protein [Bacillus sp. HMF5848]